MENMNNILVYGTTTGKKYHFSMKCSYIKGKKCETLKIKEAKFKYEGACSRCKNQNNRKNSPIINKNNNNDNLNIKKNKNNYYYNNRINFDDEQVKPLLKQKKNNNNINLLINNNKILNNIIEDEDDKKIEVSKNSISLIKNNYSDFLSSSDSFTKEINQKILLEERSSDIDFNNINNYINKNKIRLSNSNNNIVKNNNIINNKNQKLKTFEDKQDIFKDKNNNIDKGINKQEYLNNLIQNDKSEINKEKLLDINYNINNNQKSINKSSSESNLNSSNIFNNFNFNSNNKKHSSSDSNQKSKSQNFSIENNINNNKKEINIFHQEKKQQKINCGIDNGNYIFSFRIVPKKKKIIDVNIKIGFEIIYVDEDDSEINMDEESSETFDESIIFGCTYQKYYIVKNLNVHRKTNNINVLMDILKGKFLIFKDNDNSESNINQNISLQNILSSFDCQKISKDKIKEINPIFKYDSKDLKIVDIFINGNPL